MSLDIVKEKKERKLMWLSWKNTVWVKCCAIYEIRAFDVCEKTAAATSHGF